MARKNKTPQFRAGLTIDDLIAGSWINEQNRYQSTDELDFSIDIIRAVCQGLIDAANTGDRVTRRGVINTLSAISTMTMAVKDNIIVKMNNGELTPTVIDELANL